MELAPEALSLEHEARECLAERLEAAASLGLKPGEVVPQASDARAEVAFCAKALRLLLGRFSLSAEELELELAEAVLQPHCVKCSAGLSRHKPCR